MDDERVTVRERRTHRLNERKSKHCQIGVKSQGGGERPSECVTLPIKLRIIWLGQRHKGRGRKAG